MENRIVDWMLILGNITTLWVNVLCDIIENHERELYQDIIINIQNNIQIRRLDRYNYTLG